MEKRRIIDIERKLTHDRERLFALFVIVDADVARDQTAERIKGETAHRGLDAALVQFLDDLVAPIAAEAFFGQIITATDESTEKKNDRKSQERAQNPHTARDDGHVRGAVEVEAARSTTRMACQTPTSQWL